jgi:hypothetical protein
MGAISETGVPIEVDPFWGSIAATSAEGIHLRTITLNFRIKEREMSCCYSQQLVTRAVKRGRSFVEEGLAASLNIMPVQHEIN